jgi:uncharacterized protein (DUF885 family)
VTDQLSAASASDRVEAVFLRLLDHLVSSSPVEATQLGDHSRDAELDDWGPDEADNRLRVVSALQRELDTIEVDPTDAETAGDKVLLGDALDGIAFELELQRAHATDASFYLQLATGAVHELIRRDDLPLEPRAADAAARAAEIPRLLDQAKRNVTEMSQPHRELALMRVEGAVQLLGEVLPAFAPQAADNAAAAVAAVRDFGAWLDQDHGASPDWRLGAQRWRDALRLALGVRMPADQLWERAHAALEASEEAMAELAGVVLGDEAQGRSGTELIRAAVLAASAEQSPRDGLVRDASDCLEDIKSFVRETGQFELPEPDTLRVEEVPPFMQGAAVAYFVPAPPLETDAAHTYYLSPVPDSWDEEAASSFLREYNAYAVRSVGIHEAYPGHYVQLAWAQRHPRLLRRVLWNSAFAEGWAVYAETQLVAAGFGAAATSDDARMRLISAKMDLRSIANALLDQGMHVRGWSDEQAMELMTGRAYQEDAEARAKLLRAKTSAGQLSTYFVGAEEMVDLRRDAEALHGAAFDVARFHRDVLAQGTPPFPVIRRALLGETAA